MKTSYNDLERFYNLARWSGLINERVIIEQMAKALGLNPDEVLVKREQS